MQKDTKFCQECGQSSKFNNLSLSFVIYTFFETFLNLDSKLLHSFKDILIPNAITKSFIAGKRSYYVHPFRFYFFCLIAFFALLSLNTRHVNIGDSDIDLIGKYEQYAMMDTLHISNKSECEINVLDSLRNQTPEFIKNLDKDTFIDFLIFDTDYGEYGISTYDAFKMSEEKLEEKYNITKRINQLVVHQYIRMQKDPSGTFKSIVANMLWGILLLTVFMAVILKLLYLRHGSFFIEHLLHISNFHSLGLLLASLLLLVHLFRNFENLGIYASIIILGSILYLFIGLKQYYNQGFVVTLIKMIAIAFGYIFGISIILSIISIFTFLIL